MAIALFDCYLKKKKINTKIMKRKRKKKFPVAVAAAGFRDLHSQPLAPTVLTRLRVDPGKVSTRTCGRAKARVTAVSGICARLN